MDEPLDSILECCGLIGLLLSAPDIEGECPGLHRLVLVMNNHARDISSRHSQACNALNRLANP